MDLSNLVCSHGASIVAITESWLDNSVLDTEILPASFVVHRKDRSETCSSRGGGLLLAVDATVASRRRPEFEAPAEILVCELTAQTGRKLAIVLCYRPPDYNRAEFVAHLERVLFNVGRVFPSVAVIGDFNYPEINWRLPEQARGASGDFVHMMLNNGLSQVNFIPSNIHMHVLDLLFCNHIDLLSNVFKLDNCFNTDHAVLSFDLCFTVKPLPAFNRTVYNYKRANFDELSFLLGHNSHMINAIISADNVNDMWLSWSTALFDAIDLHVPKVTVSVSARGPPWFDGEARHLVNKKRTSWQSAKTRNTPAAWANFRVIRNQTTALLRAKHDEFLNSLSVTCMHNPKRFWSYFKSKTKSHSIPANVCHGDVECSAPKEKAELFNTYFASVFTQPTHLSSPPVLACSVKPLPVPVFTIEEVIKVLSHLDVNSATGPSDISPIVLKRCCHALAPSLTIMFNVSIQAGCTPSDWKRANVVPIHKKGVKENVSNYRPISLLCVASKVMERCVFNHLYPLVESSLHPLQHGFTKGRSCATQLLKVYHQIGSVLDKGGQVDVLFLDFAKAFDCISHPLLLYKLRTFYGINDQLLSWISNYLSDRSQKVVIENSSSSSLPVLSGVPQGSILGPLLFLLFINDLPSVTSSSTTALFADDSKCFMEIRSIDDCILLQNDLDSMLSWSNDWQMVFNPDKCKILSVTRSKNPQVFNYNINGSPLEHVGFFKDLGVFIDSTLSFSTHIDQLVSKCNRVCGLVKRSVGFRAPANVKIRLYKALCLSILDYCSPVWSPQVKLYIKKVEAVQRSMSKFLLNNFDISYSQRCNDLRILPLSFRREINDLLFIFKCMYGNFNVDFNEFCVREPSTNLRSSNGILLSLNLVRTETFMHSYFNRVVHLWNILPLSIRSCTSLTSFKQLLTEFYIDKLISFNPDDLCTWVSTCRCQGFYHC